MSKKDQEIIAIFEMIRKLMAPPPMSTETPKKQIGFHELGGSEKSIRPIPRRKGGV